MNGYRLIPKSEVPAWLLETAEQAAIDAAKLLDLPPVTIRWRRTDAGRMIGYAVDSEYTGEEINLVVENIKTAYEARAIVFHEVRHLWQRKTSRFLGRQDGELDAQEWSFKQTGYLIEHQAGHWEY